MKSNNSLEKLSESFKDWKPKRIGFCLNDVKIDFGSITIRTPDAYSPYIAVRQLGPASTSTRTKSAKKLSRYKKEKQELISKELCLTTAHKA